MKKIMSLFAFVLAIGLCSCDSLEPNCTVNDPFPGELEFGGYYCTGYASTGEVYIGVTVKNVGSASRVYFGDLKAYGNGQTYGRGMQVGYIGYVDTPYGVEVWVEYNEKYTKLEGVDTSLERFDKVIIPVSVNSQEDLVFENMPITWN